MHTVDTVCVDGVSKEIDQIAQLDMTASGVD